MASMRQRTNTRPQIGRLMACKWMLAQLVKQLIKAAQIGIGDFAAKLLKTISINYFKISLCRLTKPQFYCALLGALR